MPINESLVVCYYIESQWFLAKCAIIQILQRQEVCHYKRAEQNQKPLGTLINSVFTAQLDQECAHL